MSRGFKIIAEGDYALFTRPEMKLERVSYDVPPPGALEGMLKSIYWKPAIRYRVDKIVVFHAINFTNIRRNEVKEMYDNIYATCGVSPNDIDGLEIDCLEKIEEMGKNSKVLDK